MKNPNYRYMSQVWAFKIVLRLLTISTGVTCDDYSMAHQLGHIGCTDPDKRTNYKKSKVYERYTECKNSVLATGQEIDLPK